jgi:MFS family permease
VTHTAHPSTSASVSRNGWFALAVLMVGAFMALLDTTIVNVALPIIRTSLSAPNTTLSWIVSGYALTFGLALIPAGRFGDRYGHNRVFIVGLVVFTAASFGCALAHDDRQLIAARAVQGLAGGTFFTPITALIQLIFAGGGRARAFAIMGATIGVATALGPLAGGFIIEGFGTDLGWRVVFGVNVPIGVVAVAAACRLLPRGSENRAAPMDWLGLGLLSAALVALLTPLIQGQSAGWPLWTYASITASVLLCALFAVWERRVEQANGNPLVPPRLFEHPAFTSGVVLATHYHGWQLLGPLLIAGVGSGLFIAPNVDFIVATVDRADAGAASGVIGTMQRVGSAIGIAVIGTVLFGTLRFTTRGPDAVALAFGHSATLAMAVSAALSVVAFAMVFALPRRVSATPK